MRLSWGGLDQSSVSSASIPQSADFGAQPS
jgi:hypothetical protein